MPLITAQSLSKAHGTNTLFSGASFSIEEGERVGFIGPNGAGKSTLFRIIAGLEGLDSGTIALRRGARVGYLPQEPSFDPAETIRTAVAAGRPEMGAALAEYHEVAAALAEGRSQSGPLIARQGVLMERIDALGGWQWQHEVERVLTQLGLDQWDRPMRAVSGGERKRTALARVLLDAPDLLLLDEPTNHLDADTTLWLEEHLLAYSGAIMLVTHDRYVLDRVVTRMIEVGPGGFTAYSGGYTEYLEEKAAQRVLQSAEASKRDRLLAQELAWVKRSPAARTGKQRARINRLGTLAAEAEAARPTGGDLDIRFGPPPRLGRMVLELEGLSKSFGEQVLVRDLTTRLRAGERIGVIGPNGAGKTTLLRMILGEVEPDAGTVRFGANTVPAYFDQARQDLDPSVSVYDAVADEEWVTFGGRRVHVRSYLESFLFPTARHEQRVGSLSGGERNRLLLARLLLREANLLILDEPTNDLDLPTLQVLEDALASFGGCVLVVTHDRFFLDKVATGLLVFEHGGEVHRHEGGYDLYRRLREGKRAEEAARAATEGARRKSATPAAPIPARPRRLTYKERRELDGIEEQILEAEADRDRLGEELSDPALYADTPEKAGPLKTEFEEAGRRVEGLYARWAELEEIAGAG